MIFGAKRFDNQVTILVFFSVFIAFDTIYSKKSLKNISFSDFICIFVPILDFLYSHLYLYNIK